MKVWVCLIWRTTGSLKDCVTRFRDERWTIPFLALSQTPRLKVDVSWGTKHRMLRDDAPLPGSSDLSRSRKELYRDLMLGSASDPQVDRLGSAGRWMRFTCIGIGCQVRASWTTQSYRSSSGLHGTRCPFSAWITKWALQTCPIVIAAAVT